MTDPNAKQGQPPPVIDRHLPPAEPKRGGPMGSIEGVDRAGLGLEGEPVSAAPDAQVDAARTSMPGPHFGDWPADAVKPWQTTLATKNDNAEMGAEPDPEGEV